MKKASPIMLIDDDQDDLDFFKDCFASLNVENQIITFNDGYEFLKFVKNNKVDALFILCDLNMAKINGLELKKIIFDDPELRLKCIPFIFLSTSNAMKGIRTAYSLNVQGYFVKPNSYEDTKEMFASMLEYWGKSEVPIQDARL